MTRPTIEVGKAPCKTCPYRRDVPSGIWAREEYEKLPPYDGSMLDQLMNGGKGIFDCHQRDGNICAGWLGTHGVHNLLALRLTSLPLGDSLYKFKSPVPLFKSGTQAAAHGLKKIANPGEDATRAIGVLLRKRLRATRNRRKEK